MPNAITFTVSTKRPTQVTADLFIIPVYEKNILPASLSPALARQLSNQLRQLEFAGAWGTAEMIIAPKGVQASFVGLLGMGSEKLGKHQQAEGARRALGRIFQDARRHMLHEVAFLVPNNEHEIAIGVAAVEAAELATYRFVSYKKALKRQQKQRALRALTLIVEKQYATALRTEVAEAISVMQGVTVARKLVDQPASHASPAVLVEAARNIERQSKLISLTVFDRNQAAKRGFNAFLAVARGSIQEPYVIHLHYKPPQAKGKVALVGKGITFDSGGLSLKPAQHMSDMKIDMAGAATVLGVFSVLPKLRIPIEVHGIIATCENMPSGNAYRPGDVLEAMNGKTIEVMNTDAEGRVTLADALSYAVMQQVDSVVDIATLTGACMVALGETHAGLMSNNATLQKQLLIAAHQSGEGLVALPMPEEYRPVIQSQVADVTNAPNNNPMGGAITAAMFLQEFVGKTPWAHMDVAGPVYAEKPMLPYFMPGATGYGVRTLIKFLKELYENTVQKTQKPK